MKTARVPWVEQVKDAAPYPPLDQATKGRVHAMDVDEFAASLMAIGDFDIETEKVIIRKMMWALEHAKQDLGQYITKGIDDDSIAYTAKSTDVPDPRPRPPDAAAGPGFDFLDDMAADIRDSRSGKTPSGSSRSAESQLHLAILDAIGEDRDELSAHLEEMFDEDALGEELYNLVHENDAQVRAEDQEQVLEEADLVGQEPPPEEEQPANAPPTPWTNMYESPPDSHRYKDKANGKEIGRIHFIKGHAKATCKAHRACTCYVTTPGGIAISSVLVDLQGWLNEFGSSEQEHWSQSVRLKRDKYGMRLRL